MQKTVYKIADFIGWQRSDALKLSPRFQRRAVWKNGAKSYLIDTILRDYPVPIIFLRDLGTDPKTFVAKREVVDGQQRLRTVISYVAPELLGDFDAGRDAFTVSKAHNRDVAGLPFKDLDPVSQQAILNYEFSVQILPSTMDDREVVQLFRRLNSTNYTLNKQELRNATYFGEFKTSILQLSAEQLHRWRKWGTFTEDDISRMHEVEFTSECIISLIDQKIGGRLTKRLDTAYRDYDSAYPYREEIEKRFRKTMDVLADQFVPEHEASPLFRKRLAYTQIMVVADVLFGLDSPASKRVSAKTISPQSLAKWKKASESLAKRSAPAAILAATDRRTNDIKERRALFDYLRACF